MCVIGIRTYDFYFVNILYDDKGVKLKEKEVDSRDIYLVYNTENYKNNAPSDKLAISHMLILKRYYEPG